MRNERAQSLQTGPVERTHAAEQLGGYSEVDGLRVDPRQWRLVVCLVADHPPHFFDESRVRAAIGGTDPNECAGSKPKTLEVVRLIGGWDRLQRRSLAT